LWEIHLFKNDGTPMAFLISYGVFCFLKGKSDKEKIENIIDVLKSIELTEIPGANLPITPSTKYEGAVKSFVKCNTLAHVYYGELEIPLVS